MKYILTVTNGYWGQDVMNKIFLFLGILLILGVVAISGCTSTNQTANNSSNISPSNNSTVGSNNSSANSTSNAVKIQNFAFNPASLTIKAGTTVTWTNLDSTAHRIVSDTGAFQSSDLSNGQSYSYTFNKTGSYSYHCGIHPSMKGTIVVQ